MRIRLEDGVSREWKSTSNTRSSTGSEYMQSISYTCGYCGNPLASDEGYYAYEYNAQGNYTGRNPTIRVCHYCANPTYFIGDKQTPGPAFGGRVEHIPSKEVEALYEEARNCMKVNAHTAAVMCCRKLLMNIAVSEGADENKSFAYYVNHLADEGHTPVKARKWVNHIRDKGNEANHEIQIMGREDAERLLRFSEMMLRIMYEYPAEVEDPTQAAVQQTGTQTISGSGNNPPT